MKKQFEPGISGPGRNSPMVDINMSPVIGIQIGLMKENLLQSEAQVIDNNIGIQVVKEVNYEEPSLKSPIQQPSPQVPQQQQQQQQQQKQFAPTNSSSRLGQMETSSSRNDPTGFITQEMQLKAAYELQVWKEQKEKEFEQHVIH